VNIVLFTLLADTGYIVTLEYHICLKPPSRTITVPTIINIYNTAPFEQKHVAFLFQQMLQ